MDGARRGTRGRTGLHLHRHLLVLGRRRRGLRPVVAFHGAGGVAHAQMGGAGRLAPLGTVDRADRLLHGALDRRAHPEPADHPGTRLHLLLPHRKAGHAARRRLRAARRLRHPALHQQPDHSLHGIHRRDVRRAVRQYVRTPRQFGHRLLLAGAHRHAGLGLVVRLPPQQARVEHRAARRHDDPRRLLVLRFGDARRPTLR